jgi:hypothetical protein
MAITRRLVILIGIYLTGIGVVWAADKEEPSQLTALWLDGRRPAGDLFIADAKGHPQKLTVGVATRGALVTLPPGEHVIALLRKVAASVVAQAAAAPAAASYESAGEVAWPASGARKALLFLVATNQVGTPLSVRGVAIADDLKGFPLGTVRFANFLGAELIGRVGEEVKPVAVGSSAAIPYPVQAKPELKAVPNFAVGLARMEKNGNAALIFNSRMDAWPHSRSLVLIIPGKTAEADPMVRTVVEIIPPVPPVVPMKPSAAK